MKRHVAPAAWVPALLACGPLFAADAPAPSGKYVPIFDGKTFEGWEGPLEAFRIEGGAVVGGSLQKPVPRNEFISTKKEYADFELRLKVKCVGKGANGGIQIRSRRVPNSNEMSGYQSDMGEGYWGDLYDESRRNKPLVKARRDELAKVLKADDWNDYVIRCEGKRIQQWINGYQTVDYTEADDKIELKGVIGLQIHGGPPTETWYKDVVVKELPSGPQK
jgi:hypothetical protein